MKGKQAMFFGTKEDLETIIREVEQQFDIKYFEMGLFDDKKDFAYKSIDEIHEFGKPRCGDLNRDLRLMIMPKELNLRIREVPQQRGGMKYAVDPLENQTSICFQFGGVVREGILLAGKVGTSFLSNFALDVFKEFYSLLRKRFKKIGTFYVGEEAEKKLKAGWRLVTNEKSPKEYDLALN